MQSKGMAKPVILADTTLEESGVDFRQVVDLPLHIMPPMTEEEAPGIIERALFKVGGPSSVLPFTRKRCRKQFSAREAAFNKALDQVCPDIVVLSNGRTSMRDLPLIKICRERGVRSIAFPVALPAYGASLTSRRKGQFFKGKYYPSLVRKYPGQYLTDQSSGETVSYYPAHMILELESAGILPPNPWVVGANLCDTVLLAGENERDLLLGGGAEPERLSVTGLRAHDSLYELLGKKEELRKHLSEKYGLPAHGKLMIAALPQSAEEGMLTWERHWQEIRFICQTIKEIGAPTLISLHPRMKREQYGFVETEYGLPIAEERLADFLPVGDIFSSSFSSTVQWAVLCGIPSVIWPWFGVDYDVFDPFSGIKVVKKKDQLSISYQQLISDENLFSGMALEQRRQADRFSPFDGRCMERIIEVICAGKQPAVHRGK
jgi:hypothetical protein